MDLFLYTLIFSTIVFELSSDCCVSMDESVVAFTSDGVVDVDMVATIDGSVSSELASSDCFVSKSFRCILVKNVNVPHQIFFVRM